MQGHFCFMKLPIFAFLPDIDVCATCCMNEKACLYRPYCVCLHRKRSSQALCLAPGTAAQQQDNSQSNSQRVVKITIYRGAYLCSQPLEQTTIAPRVVSITTLLCK